MSAAHLGHKNTPEHCAKISAALLGHKHAPETRAKISSSLRGRKLGPHSPEHRAKIAASLRGHEINPETRAKLSAAQRGHKHTPDSLAKMSAAMMGNKNSLGHKISPEHRAKISLSHKGRFTGAKHPNWKGGINHIHGYIMLYRPGHPHANIHHYVAEHRLVMEGILGRYLTSGEQVHHRNGVRDDNRPENLQVVAPSNHYGEVLCPFCQGHFLVR